mmetsp:Transcript_12396/g.40514  ORF Transcript_12396/g.40514 Transcript_12396/m.40514 type:complete len:223 (+) Transcript_12396:582-1250(+)
MMMRKATFVCVAPLFVLDGERTLLLEAAAYRVRAQRIRDWARSARDYFFPAAAEGGNVLAVHVRRESTDLGCDDKRRYVVCPDIDARGVSTREVIQAIAKAATNLKTRNVYLAHAGNGPEELIDERDKIIAALSSSDDDDPERKARSPVVVVASASKLGEMAKATGAADLSPFDVSLIEQELCLILTAFLPSARSTWSATVTLDREARSLRVLRPIDWNLRV